MIREFTTIEVYINVFALVHFHQVDGWIFRAIANVIAVELVEMLY